MPSNGVTCYGFEMKSSCEKCDGRLEAAGDAFVCSYECTFCPACTKAMSAVCPNCAGELVRGRDAQSRCWPSQRNSVAMVAKVRK